MSSGRNPGPEGKTTGRKNQRAPSPFLAPLEYFARCTPFVPPDSPPPTFNPVFPPFPLFWGPPPKRCPLSVVGLWAREAPWRSPLLYGAGVPIIFLSSRFGPPPPQTPPFFFPGTIRDLCAHSPHWPKKKSPGNEKTQTPAPQWFFFIFVKPCPPAPPAPRPLPPSP